MEKKRWEPSMEIVLVHVSEDAYKERLSELANLLLNFQTMNETMSQVENHISFTPEAT